MVRKNKFRTEYILGLIGGIIGVVGAGLLLLIAPFIAIAGVLAEDSMLVLFGVLYLLWAIWAVVWNIIIIVKARNFKKGHNIRKSAIWLIIASVLASINIFGIIAGIMVLSKTKK